MLRLDTAKKVIQEYVQSGEKDLYFGAEPKFKKALEAALKNFTLCITTAENKLSEDAKEKYPDEPQYQVLRKQMQAMLDVARAWGKSNYKWSTSFAEQYKASLVFLRSSPTAAVPFPPWLKQKHLLNAVTEASIASFWQYLSADALTEAGYTLSTRRVSVTLEMVKMKALTALSEEGDSETMAVTFIDAFPKEVLDSNNALQLEVQMLRSAVGMLRKGGLTPDGELDEAMAANSKDSV